jgi:hypothetical protein
MKKSLLLLVAIYSAFIFNMLAMRLVCSMYVIPAALSVFG